MLISDVQAHHRPDLGVIYLTSAILVLAAATLIIRIGSAKFPSPASDEPGRR